MSENSFSDINCLEGLYAYGSGETDQLYPLQEYVKEEKYLYESSIPRKIPLHFKNKDEKIASIKCGSQFTIVLTNQGNVYTFGCSDNGALGHEESISAQIVPLKFPATGISGGKFMALHIIGKIWHFGVHLKVKME